MELFYRKDGNMALHYNPFVMSDKNGNTVDRVTGKKVPGQYLTSRPNYTSNLPPVKKSTSANSSKKASYSGGSSYSAPAAQAAPASSGPSYADAYADALASIMAEQRRQREAAYQKAAAAQKENLSFATNQLTDTTNDALKQAYINKMQTLRNLPQQMSAQGLNGGASETTLASMNNNYGNARNQLETERLKQLASLQNTYQNNLAQLEAQRASGDAAQLSNLAPTLANLVATNTPASVNITQGSGGNAGNVSAWLRKLMGYDDEDYYN